jgi:hypothetical protein
VQLSITCPVCSDQIGLDYADIFRHAACQLKPSLRDYFKQRDAQTKELARQEGRARQASRLEYLASRAGLGRQVAHLMDVGR